MAAILVVAVLAARSPWSLPPQLVGMRYVGPYVLLFAATAVSAWFNRERAFVLAGSLLAAFTANDQRPDTLTYVMFATLVPLNTVVALALPERGVRFRRAWRWVALLLFEVLVAYFLEQSTDVGESLDNWLLRSPPTPWLARLAFGAAFAAAAARAWPNHTPAELGVGGALAAFFVACEWSESPESLTMFPIFVTAAGVILLVAVLQESYRMAFRDALTGLPNRRALEEQLRTLEEPYAVAMIDIDHFKKFNDTHGHDTGDQVLRLVASRLAEVGGGRAFRYGGEEFTVLFRGQHLADALPHLEATRAAVEGYRMTIRGADRPKDKEEGSKRRAALAEAKPDLSRTDLLLSVTVSIGAAEPGKRMKTPKEVVKGADEALYRAKERGRNRVSR